MLSSWSVFVSGSQRVTGRRWEISSGKDGQLAKELLHLIDGQQGLPRRGASPVHEITAFSAQRIAGVDFVPSAPGRTGNAHDAVIIVPEIGLQLFPGAVQKILNTAGMQVLFTEFALDVFGSDLQRGAIQQVERRLYGGIGKERAYGIFHRRCLSRP